jgi:hypothetical protein
MEFNSFSSSNKHETRSSQEDFTQSHVERLKQKLGVENFPDNEELLITERATKKVIENILSENNGKLPEFIIYPETSARVLPYLFNPSFRKMAEKTGSRPPMSYFMSVFGAHEHPGFEIEGSVEFMENPARNLLESERAQEILENAKLQGFNTKTVFVVDDTLIDGKSKSSIKRAFNGKDIKMHYLLSHHPSLFNDPNRDDVGYSFPDGKRRGSGKPIAPFWKLPDENKLRQTGVVKNKEDKYVSAYKGSLYQDKKYLRDILSAIGEDVYFQIEEGERVRKETEDFLNSYYAESN